MAEIGYLYHGTIPTTAGMTEERQETCKYNRCPGLDSNQKGGKVWT